MLQMRPSSFYNRLNLRDNEDYTVLIAQLISSFREVSPHPPLVPRHSSSLLSVSRYLRPTTRLLHKNSAPSTTSPRPSSWTLSSIFKRTKCFLGQSHISGSVFCRCLATHSEMRSISAVVIWSRKSGQRPRPSCDSSSTHRTSSRHSAPSSRSAPFRLCSRVSSRTSEWNSVIMWEFLLILLVLSATHNISVASFPERVLQQDGLHGGALHSLLGRGASGSASDRDEILESGRQDRETVRGDLRARHERGGTDSQAGTERLQRHVQHEVCVLFLVTSSLDLTFNILGRNAHNCGSALQHTLITTA